MNRADFVAALAAATAAPGAPPAGDASAAPTPITASFDLKRDGDALLAPFTVSIALHNPTARVVQLDFATADLFRIDVRRDGESVWSTTAGHRPLLIASRVDVSPGVTRLASQIVDGITDDHRAYAPGAYTVHVALLGDTLTSVFDWTLTFAQPLPIASARTTLGPTVVTIAGVPRTDVNVTELQDATGTIRLSRPLGLHPTGTYVVRGYLDALRDDVQFTVARFAPAFDNTAQARPKPPA